MLVVDTSALVAILLREPEAESFAQAIIAAGSPVISAGSYMELVRVMKFKRGPQAVPMVEQLIQMLGLTIMSVTPQQATLATRAVLNYSILNFGDAFTYVLAKDQNAPVLFKGDDFSQTDVEVFSD